MFGLNKIKEAKEQAEVLKQKLGAQNFTGSSANGMVTIKCTGDKRFHSLDINDSIFKIRSREEVQDMILEAIERASYQADETVRKEMAAIMPNIPGVNL